MMAGSLGYTFTKCFASFVLARIYVRLSMYDEAIKLYKIKIEHLQGNWRQEKRRTFLW